MKTVVALASLILLSSLPVAAQTSRTFGKPVFTGTGKASSRCDALRSQLVVLDDKKSFSFLVADPFLTVGDSGPLRQVASCELDAPVEGTGSKSEEIQVEVQLSATKYRDVETRLVLRIGKQTHRVDHLVGQILDAASSPDRQLRFRVRAASLQDGRLRISISGQSRSLSKDHPAIYAFGRVSACFVEPSAPDVCGSPLDGKKE